MTSRHDVPAPPPSTPRTSRQALPLLRRAPGAPPAVVAHRGSSASAPENTLAALEAARRAGGSWMEVDLRRTGDDVVVLLHDDHLSRTTDGSGRLAETSAVDLAHLDAGSWFSREHAGEPVPTLADVLVWARRHPGVHLLLELKGTWSPLQARLVTDAVRSASVRSRVVLQSFDPVTVASLAAVGADCARGLLLDGTGPVEATGAEVARLVAAHGLACVNPGDGVLAADLGLADRLHALGVAVWTWTVDDPARWADLDAAGVDGVITNTPGAMLGWLAERPRVPAQARSRVRADVRRR
ncbi:glycerophosphodiester phosphodiesterase [Pseudokineococcus sp. 1T1Z-3]|uniref:glycerophosphodiester phosphodiesterase n=1 Tax=Pseudokineococcus sp. 1T1Z-3 TaxID=3132745 RepID=UPI0030A24C8D